MMGGTQYYDNLNQKPFANLQELLESISE